jgi:riboflavin kinase/FMN adenylyltransferase
MKITVLGSGTSTGVPTVGCQCDVCTSADPRDKRLRPSVLLSYNGRNVLIDTTPDFRTQALRAGIRRLDAILFTHDHADHIMGLDDVRPFNFRQKGRIPFYAAPDTMESIQRCFRYIFDGKAKESSTPQLEPRLLDGQAFDLFGLEVQPIRLLHGRASIFGFRFGRAAYLTDHSEIPPESVEKLRGLDVLFLDALRHRAHPTHTTVERALRHAEELAPSRTFFTHICHDLGHAETEGRLPPHIRMAYDGLEIEVAARHTARIYRSLEELPDDAGPSAVTIGNFDGLHAGHQSILRRMAEVARAKRWKPTVLTFDPHPAKIVAPFRAPRLMSTPAQRIEWMEEQGVEQVLILPFTEQLARLTPEEFVEGILVRKLGARAVLVGGNFRFGHDQKGDPGLLERLGKSHGFHTEVIPGLRLRGAMVSSSGIRKLIEWGEVARACRQLGRPYSLEGDVVPGRGIGSRQTVPTLNLAAQAEVLPGVGVYVTRTRDLDPDGERCWPSITNIGRRPTFGGEGGLTIETFLLEPLEGATPQRIRVEFLRRVRDERKFDSAEQLKAQILRDVERARTYFRRLERTRLGAGCGAVVR